MELNQLRYFLAVAETQHVTKSAEELHIAQPALTKSIHKLEDELGVPLFVSKGRGIVLTEYGKYLKGKLTPIIEELDSVQGKLEMMSKLENETVHLNVLAASTLVTSAIIEYKKLNDKIHFQVMQNSESDLYDIGITTKVLFQPSERKSQTQFIATEEIFLAVPRSHRLAKKNTIELSEVQNESFISLMGSRQLRWICDKFCSTAGFKPNIIFESDNPSAVKNMISANIGIGFWPQFTWGELENDRVKLLRIKNPVCMREILFDCHNNKSDSSAVNDFFEFLRDYTLSKEKASRR